jgi:hypothetical protein
MHLQPGSRLGPYEVIAPLGAGGMGEVYRARDTRLGRDVAVKVLPHLFLDDPDRLMRFEREAKTLASLNHPHIAQIHGFEESGSVRALVMELVEGALSPNGRLLAYVTIENARAQLRLRDLSTGQSRVLAEEDEIGEPFFSADSQSVAFSTGFGGSSRPESSGFGGVVRKVAVTGGAPTTVIRRCSGTPVHPRGRGPGAGCDERRPNPRRPASRPRHGSVPGAGHELVRGVEKRARRSGEVTSPRHPAGN